MVRVSCTMSPWLPSLSTYVRLLTGLGMYGRGREEGKEEGISSNWES